MAERRYFGTIEEVIEPPNLIEVQSKSYEDFLQDMVDSRNIPIGRIGEAEEFANIACFLASDASGYISGTAINVDGGRSPVV